MKEKSDWASNKTKTYDMFFAYNKSIFWNEKNKILCQATDKYLQ